jgi:RNA 3'-terminal phosphate cyclase (ATP)
MALAGGGRFTTVKPSQHTLTAAALIGRFMGQRILIEKTAEGVHVVELG